MTVVTPAGGDCTRGGQELAAVCKSSQPKIQTFIAEESDETRIGMCDRRGAGAPKRAAASLTMVPPTGSSNLTQSGSCN